MKTRIHLGLEIVRESPLILGALPALEAAKERGDGRPLAMVARAVLGDLRRAVAAGDGRFEGGGVGHRAIARLEVVVATEPDPPATEAALEETAWALLAAARVAPPVSLGEDWDVLRLLLDPARRRGRGIGVMASSLAGSALVGSGPLESASGFGLARSRSYMTGWNDRERTARVARALERWTPTRLEDAVTRIGPGPFPGLYPPGPSTLRQRFTRARAPFERLKNAYALAAREGAGVFVELELV